MKYVGFKPQLLNIDEIEKRIEESENFKIYHFENNRRKGVYRRSKGVLVKVEGEYRPSLAHYIYITSKNRKNYKNFDIQKDNLEELLGEASSFSKKNGRSLFVARYDYSVEDREEVEKTFINYLVSEK